MKANELRIGNWVQRKDVGIEVTVETIKNQTIRTNKGVQPLAIVEPIPLTEEWVEKFGFIKGFDWYEGDFHSPIKELEDNQYLITPHMTGNWSFSICPKHGIDGGRLFLRSIQYVHQLQNLYFDLTSEELEIK